MKRIAQRKESGQALPLGIAFLMSTILLGIVLFNTGQSASEKSRIVNTADAAVYSGLVWQARALNFQAYTNRAMVANNVSIGQMVSLTSWTKYAYIVARNIDYIGNFFPVVKPYTSMAKSITSSIDSAAVNVAEAIIPVIDNVDGILSETQRAIFLASFAATPAIVNEVVEKNDSRYNVNTAYAVVGMGQNGVNWNNFVKRYEDNEGLLRKTDVVNRSLDQFTSSRNLNTGDLLPGAPNVLNLGLIRAWVKKEGTTRLISEETTTTTGNIFQNQNTTSQLEWEWKGKDTLSFHIEVWGCSWRSGCGWDHDEVPLGWGERYLNGDFECEDIQQQYSWWWSLFSNNGCPRYMQQNRRAERLADLERDKLDAEYEGIRAYYDLSDLRASNRDPRLALRIEVELPQNQVRTASKIDGLGSDSVPQDEIRNGIGEGMFGTEDQMAGEGMAAIASGELFFHPPDDYDPARRGGRHEIASLFSPYWEVRLTKISNANRFMAWALRDESLVTEAASGVAEGVERYISDRTEELERLRDLVESLQDQLDDTVDTVRRVELEARLASVRSEISALEMANYNTDALANSLRQGLAQGVSQAAQTQVGRYENMLQQYSEQQGQAIVDQFQDEIVGQITDQMQQSLQNAVEDAAESALTSFL